MVVMPTPRCRLMMSVKVCDVSAAAGRRCSRRRFHRLKAHRRHRVGSAPLRCGCGCLTAMVGGSWLESGRKAVASRGQVLEIALRHDCGRRRHLVLRSVWTWCQLIVWSRVASLGGDLHARSAGSSWLGGWGGYGVAEGTVAALSSTMIIEAATMVVVVVVWPQERCRRCYCKQEGSRPEGDVSASQTPRFRCLRHT